MVNGFGKKLKSLSTTLLTIGLLANIFGGLGVGIMLSDGPEGLIIAVPIAAVGIVFTLVFSTFLEAFGQLVDDVNIMSKYTYSLACNAQNVAVKVLAQNEKIAEENHQA